MKISVSRLRKMIREALVSENRQGQLENLLATTLSKIDRASFQIFLDLLEEESPETKDDLIKSKDIFQVLDILSKKFKIIAPSTKSSAVFHLNVSHPSGFTDIGRVGKAFDNMTSHTIFRGKEREIAIARDWVTFACPPTEIQGRKVAMIAKGFTQTGSDYLGINSEYLDTLLVGENDNLDEAQEIEPGQRDFDEILWVLNDAISAAQNFQADLTSLFHIERNRK